MTRLPEPTTAKGREGLAAVLADPAAALAALDYDGTLAPIVPRPEEALPAPGALAALRELAERLGSVVLITGRPVGQLLKLTGLRDDATGARLTVLAQYGLQRWDGRTGELTSPPELPGVQRARRELQQLVGDRDAPPGVTIEDKGQALVVHTRQTPNPQAILKALTPRLTTIAEEAGLEPHPARNALELRPPGFEKGGALRCFARERDAKAVLFVGDDIGDLPAFETLDELRSQGIPGLGVVSDSEEVSGLREHADLVLPGPNAIVAFLSDLAAALGSRR